MTVRAVAVWVLATVWWSCAPDPAPPGPASRPPTDDWRADYPLPARLSADAPGWYQASPILALEGIAGRLQGNCTYESWRFAMHFFERAGPEGAEAVLPTLEKALLRQDLRDLARNCCEALARAKDPRAVPTLLRAATNREPSVSEMAVEALGAIGSKDALRKLWGGFADLVGEAQRALVNASGRVLQADVLDFYAAVLREPQLQWLWAAVLTQTKDLPAEVQRKLLLPLYQRLPGTLRFQAACLLQMAGADEVTAEVVAGLAPENPVELRIQAIAALSHGDPARHAERILPLLEDQDAKVQQAVVQALAKAPGENIDRALGVMVMSPDANIRSAALKAYHDRGLRPHLDRLLEDVRQKSGTVFRQACEDLVKAGDLRAIQAANERLPQAQGTDRRILLQTMAHLRHRDALPALAAVFLGPDEPLGSSDELRSTAYLGVLLTNLEDADQELVEMFRTKLRDDPIRRAHLLKTLANMAGITTDPQRKARLRSFLLEVIKDRKRLTQERLLALDFAVHMVTLDYVMELKRQLPDEEARVRRLINNWLWEFCGPAKR